MKCWNCNQEVILPVLPLEDLAADLDTAQSLVRAAWAIRGMLSDYSYGHVVQSMRELDAAVQLAKTKKEG